MRGRLFKQTERQFNRWMVIGLVAGFALLIAAFVLIVLGLRSSAASSELVRHTYEVKDSISELTVALERSETARRGYLLSPSAYRESVYRNWSPRVLPAINALETLTSDSQAHAEQLRTLRALVVTELSLLDRSMDLATGGELAKARATFGQVDALSTLQAIRRHTSDIAAAEERLLNQRLAAANEQRSLLNWLLVLTGVMLAAVASFTFWLVRRFTRDLLASQARLHVLNTNLEGVVAERTSDLQRANDEIQRFAYIVSHDLRSPLVNVMGFTAEMERADKIVADFVDRVEVERPDLITEEVRLAAREDLPESLGFIRSSTQKMDRLINAILALSRQGRRLLTPEKLDMDRLIGDIADSLAVQAEERGATITIERPLPEIVHDRLAIEQIFSNLIENATKYLAIGRPGEISIRGKRDGSRATFEVQDNGRGVAPSDHERIFELFRRSGAQDQKGEGIGLANVRALAYRLGGTVTMRSILGVGYTFFVDLPVVYADEGKEGR
jgi:signal transduction histidine kinase